MITSKITIKRRAASASVRVIRGLILFLVLLSAASACAQGLPPRITNQPPSQIVAYGSEVTFAVGAVSPSGTPLRFQWLKGPTLLAGATNSTLVLTNVQTTAAGTYSVQVSNAGGTVASANAALEVVRLVDQSVSLGANVTFKLIASGPDPPSGFQWSYQGVDIAGATKNSLDLSNVTLAQAGAYAVVVSNGSGSTTVTATLDVDPTFTKLGPDAGITSASGNGVWGDYDNDGFLDMFVRAYAGGADRLFHNNGDGSFMQIANSVLVTVVGNAGMAWGDYDNDGLLDLLVANRMADPISPVSPFLFHNTGGGTFTRIAGQAPANLTGNFISAAWADYDNDGFLDALVTSNEGGNFLYRNDHGTGFIRIRTGPIVTDRVGTALALWGDYDNDGFVDLFVMNNAGPSNFLYRNNGDGMFTKIKDGPVVGDIPDASSAGAAWGDYDNDGFLDLFVANGAAPDFLYHNNKDGTFTKITSTAATTDPRGSNAAAWGDYDDDGFLDLYVARAGGDGKNALYHNNGDGTFTRIGTGSPVNDVQFSHGCSLADYDNDGFPDLFAYNQSGNNALYRNNGNLNNWIKLRLVGTLSNRAGIGARVRVLQTIRGQTMWLLREISTGDGWNQDGLRADFGLGDATVADTVRIEWPSGIVQELHNVAPKQYLTVTEAGVGILPYKQELVVGSTMSFRAATTLAAPVNYQWRFNGVTLADGPEIAGATSATLTILNAQTASAGEYTVVVSKADGTESLTSFPVYLTLPGLPVIATPPQSQIVVAGADVTLTASVLPSSSPVRYQWQKGVTPIAGATAASLVLTDVLLSAGADYSVVVSNSAGSVTSANATLEVVRLTDQSVSLGANVTFRLAARGPDPPTAFQWRFHGVDIAGATTDTLVLSGVTLDSAGAYALVVSNASGSITISATLEVDPTFTVITSSPAVKETGNFRGASWGDYDNDGDLDLFVARRDGRNLLFQNNGDGSFTKVTTGRVATDVTDSMSGAWADYDNDGKLDLFVANHGKTEPQADSLYRNNGDGTFTRITNTVLANDGANASGSAWGDYDNDGHLDLFVSNEATNVPGKNLLYHNNRDGSFTRIRSGSLALDNDHSMGFGWADYDNDGDLDLFVANGYRSEAQTALYRNDTDGTFMRVTSGPVAEDIARSVAGAWGDYDNDGDLDLFIANQSPRQSYLYGNNGDGTFARITLAPVTTDESYTISASWADYDNDGHLDLFVVNDQAVNFLYHNNGDGTFSSISSGSLVNDRAEWAAGAAWGDYDRDGFLDLCVARGTAGNGPAQLSNSLYRNNGNSNGWLIVKCVGQLSNRTGIGAKVRVNSELRTPNSELRAVWQLREITGGDSFQNNYALYAHFGLGDATKIDTVRIEWPSGIVQEMHDVAVKQFLTVTEPDVRVEPKTVEFEGGKSVTFTCTTTIPSPLFQWQLNGLDLTDETGPTLTLTITSAASAGKYSCVVSRAGSTETASASGTIKPPVPPAITTQPVSQTVDPGASVSFTVAATGSPPLSYQWSLNGEVLTGATDATLNIPSAQPENAGDYTVTVSNAGGSVTSGAATLTLIGAAKIVTQPKDQSVSLGANVTFEVRASGTAPFTYQWRLNGADIEGATSRTLVLSNVTLADSGKRFSVLVKNALGSATSRDALLDVDPTFTAITTGPMVEDRANFRSAAWGDYDNDGDLDLYVATDDTVDFFYRNNGDGTFSRVTKAEAGISVLGAGVASFGAAWGDYDNDGKLDLFTTGCGETHLYKNLGEGRFEEPARPGGFGCDHAISWADYDNDGFLDLYLAEWGSDGVLLRNEVGKAGGRALIRVRSARFSGFLSVTATWADYDNDGDLDLFVANSSNQNTFYRNNGDGTFSQVPSASPVARTSNGTVGAWADYDNDGDLDLYVTTGGFGITGRNAFFRNDGNGVFSQITSGPPVDELRNSWGAAWGDYDNDGYLDLYVANQGPSNTFYRNLGNGSFERITRGSPANDPGPFITPTWGDFDNDGFLDLFVTSGVAGLAPRQDRNRFYRNNGNGNHWIRVKCVGGQREQGPFLADGRGALSNRDGIGAKVRLKATIRGQAMWQLREITGGSAYGTSSPLEAHFGLGDATMIETLRIEWPSGTVQELRNVAVNQFLTVHEPRRPQLAGALAAGGEFRLTLTGEVGASYVVEVSSDLRQWQELVTLKVVEANGVVGHVDAAAAREERRFYRAVGR